MEETIQSSREWLEYARQDWQAANYLTTAKPELYKIICYHCEQAVEKALKSFLVYHEVDFPRTHDLVELCKLCTNIDLRYYEIAEGCSELTGYGTQMRYPSGVEVDKTEMREALATCEVIIDFIETTLDFEQEQGPHISM